MAPEGAIQQLYEQHAAWIVSNLPLYPEEPKNPQLDCQPEPSLGDPNHREASTAGPESPFGLPTCT